MSVVDEKWFLQEDDHLIEHYLSEYNDFMRNLPDYLRRKECVSGLNRVQRLKLRSSSELNIGVVPGDICFIDYGQVYINEAGYQHFGLVISEFNDKLFVVPMTSNREMVRRSSGPNRRKHLYNIGQVLGLNRPSVLFLNDCKYINSSRIISVNAHICPDSEMFAEISSHLKRNLFP